jgi:hypothetical protein
MPHRPLMSDAKPAEAMPRELKNWEVLRRKGKARFIMENGILYYGLPMFGFMTFFVNRRADEPLVPFKVIISAVIWTLGGAAFGWVMWKLTEDRYQKYLAKQAGSSPAN